MVDTFHQKNLTEEWKEGLFTEAQKKIERQRKTQITVITTNPPYLAGQHKYGDQIRKTEYPDLNTRIKSTYMKKSDMVNNVSLYDSYIRALRYASDRIGDSGIIAMITNAGFLKSGPGAGIRASLSEEFDEIWCLDLLGKKGVMGHGRNIFEYAGNSGGTTVNTAILILVKKPTKKGACVIKYSKLGTEYYSGESKRNRVKELGSIKGIRYWTIIKPDKYHDWLDQRGESFSKYTALGDRGVKGGKGGTAIFKTYSRGLATGRDAWAYNSSKKKLAENMKKHIGYCNSQDPNNPQMNSRLGKWDSHLTSKLKRKQPNFNRSQIRTAMYRPFFKQYVCFDSTYNQEQPGPPPFFPHNDTRNPTICIPDKFGEEFSAFVTDITPDLHIIAANQCFPLYIYENGSKRENVTDQILAEYQIHYSRKITKGDVFYYVYGMLHHPGYKKTFANNLIRELPRIPMAPNFAAFRDAGKALADLHLNFETCKRHNLGKPKFNPARFTKLDFGKKSANKETGRQKVRDHAIVRANCTVLFDKIPQTTYRVNDRTPLEWIVDRYKVKSDTDSGIINDPCTGTDIVAVIERAVHIGLESERIIASLPEEFEPKDWKPAKKGLDAHAK